MRILLPLLALSLGCELEDDGPADSDGDGLTDSEEADLGTDPDAEDSDGDGYLDPQEVEDGTNPLYEFSHLYPEGGYNVGTCPAAPAPTGPTGTAEVEYQGQTYTWTNYAKGDVADNFTLMDQYGQEVSLYSFCGQYVMFSLGASWCPPCQDLAAEIQGIQDTYGEMGFQAIEILYQDKRYNEPDDEDLLDWEELGSMVNIPVLALPEGEWGFDGLLQQYDADLGIPSIVHLGPDMEVLSMDRYETDPGKYVEEDE
jgi:thiol-disulfide isomerase/thioredoxin